MSCDFVRATRPLTGTVRVPGDKSISHRAVILAAMAEGTSHLSGVLDSADVRASVSAVESLGARVSFGERDHRGLSMSVTGWGGYGPHEPQWHVECHNSGTTARLMMGVVSGWPIAVTFTGDRSLSKRPMRRIVEPLSQMGATFEVDAGGSLPVTVHGTDHLAPLAYPSPIASAQVKSAVLLAGLRATGRTRVTEPTLSRDHTERMLPAFGVPVIVDEAPGSTVMGPAVPRSTDIVVPGDPSSAAFLVAVALLVPGSEITIEDVSLNPTRIGFLHVLERMGALVEAVESSSDSTDPVGTISAAYSAVMTGTTVSAAEVPALVDEIPILALVASQASRTTRFEGVGELRVKESDRLSAIAEGLGAFGVSVRTGSDWLEVDGPCPLAGAVVDSLGDHRLAMMYAVAGLIADGVTRVERFEAVDVSFPTFGDVVGALLPDEEA